MRIGFDAKRLFRNRTGLGNYSRSLLRQLIAFHPENNYILYGSKPGDTTLFSDLADSSHIELNYSEAKPKAYWRSVGIKKDLVKDDITIFHGLSNELPLGLNKTGIKSVVTIHDLIFKHYPETFPFIDRKIYDLKFKLAAKNADRVLAISQSTKKDIIRFYKIDESKVDVIYQCCDPLFYKAPENKLLESVKEKYTLPEEFILCVSSLEARKNIETLIQAYSLLPESSKLPLLIVGKGSLSASLQHQSQKLGLTKYIRFLDSVSDNTELQALYSLAKALIYPSKYEGFGLPIVEALLSDTPVITADNSSLREAGGPNSLYFDTMNPKDLAHKIASVIEDESLASQMSETGKKYALAEFGLKTQADKLIELYQSL